MNRTNKDLTKILDSSKKLRLTSEQEKELFTKYHSLKRRYNKRLIRNKIVMGNVGLILKVASKFSYLDPSELLSEGMVVLDRCIDNFDINRGFKFSTYAYRALFMSFIKIHKGYFQDLDRYKNEEIEESYKQDYETEDRELLNKLNKLLESLTERERLIIKGRFYQNCTLQEIGDACSLSKERVRQIIKDTLVKMGEDFAKIYNLDGKC